MKKIIMLTIPLLAISLTAFAQAPAAITAWTIQQDFCRDMIDAGSGPVDTANPTQMGGGVIVGDYIYMVGGFNFDPDNIIGDNRMAYRFLINPYYGSVGPAERMALLPEDAATALSGDENYAYIHDAVVATDDHIYIHGGSWNASGAERNVCTYTEILGDGTLAAWSVSGVYPGTYVGDIGVAAICENGYLYLIGGYSFNDVVYAQIQPDGSLGSWTVAADMPRIANFAAITSIGNHIILLPAIDTAWDRATITKKLYVCEVNTDGTMGSWVEQTEEVPDFVYNGNLEAVGNTIFMVGGRNNGASPNAEPWVWRATFNGSAAAADQVTGWTDGVDAQLPCSTRYHEVAYSEKSKSLYVFSIRSDRDGGTSPWDTHIIPTGVVNEVMISSPLFERPVQLNADPKWVLYE